MSVLKTLYFLTVHDRDSRSQAQLCIELTLIIALGSYTHTHTNTHTQTHTHTHTHTHAHTHILSGGFRTHCRTDNFVPTSDRVQWYKSVYTGWVSSLPLAGNQIPSPEHICTYAQIDQLVKEKGKVHPRTGHEGREGE